MRPPEGDDVSARASPQSSWRRASLDSARPPRSFDRSRALPPPRRAPVGSAGDAAGVTKNFRRGLPRILALGWRFGRSGTKIGGLFSPYPNLSNLKTKYPHHREPSFNQGLSCNLRRSIATPERRLWRLNRLTFPAPPTPSTKQTGEPPTDSHETKGRFPLVRRVSGRTREAAARSRRRRVGPARLPEPDLAAGFVLPTATGRNDSTPDLRRDSLEHVTRSHGACVRARAIAFVAFLPVHPREPTRLGALYTQD